MIDDDTNNRLMELEERLERLEREKRGKPDPGWYWCERRTKYHNRSFWTLGQVFEESDLVAVYHFPSGCGFTEWKAIHRFVPFVPCVSSRTTPTNPDGSLRCKDGEQR